MAEESLNGSYTVKEMLAIIHSEIKEDLSRIEKKLDGSIDDHEDRIRNLERWRWRFGIPASVIAGLLAALGITNH
jgi:hypothetical protein